MKPRDEQTARVVWDQALTAIEREDTQAENSAGHFVNSAHTCLIAAVSDFQVLSALTDEGIAGLIRENGRDRN